MTRSEYIETIYLIFPMYEHHRAAIRIQFRKYIKGVVFAIISLQCSHRISYYKRVYSGFAVRFFSYMHCGIQCAYAKFIVSLFRKISRNFSLRVKNILGEHKRAELNVDGAATTFACVVVHLFYVVGCVSYIVVCIKY